MSLSQEIDKHAAVVSTSSYSMSVGEMISMYRDGELDLHPEFQRFFRWTPEQKSRFIESLLLSIPIPPIFVAERGDSKWDVIDGLQRLSTILELLGELRNEDGTIKPALKLTKTRYLPSLADKEWSASEEERQLPEDARIRIKRARLDINIVRNTSSKIAKYEIFQRLNTGGSIATDQEVRSCILIMVNREFFQWARELADEPSFRECIPMTDRAQDEAYDLELFVRFLVLTIVRRSELRQIAELGDFLTEESIKIASDPDFDRDKLATTFRSLFEFLAANLRSNSFRRHDSTQRRYLGPMLISLFEVVAIGLGRRLLRGRELPAPEQLLKAHKRLWKNPKLIDYVGSGVNASRRIPKTVLFGEAWLA
ncbi:DUF262 domain-containing protein [Sorangium sp. So ce1036]|uniref:DUF262 domain-containing protein n=1 Tax=Sorangium sp. So ce1036 TaxID=3133328 RepID=UPI003F0A0A42